LTKPFVSLCMIVKNEEKVLGRCLDSVAGLVDEIVIVDTGSADGTKQVASRYTDRIYDFEWTDSFADARNFAQSKASGEWILVLDADEYVERANLEDAIQELRNMEPVDALICTIYNFVGLRGEEVFQHQSLRIYKNDTSIRFVRAIHEQLSKETGELTAKVSRLNIYHSGYLTTTMQEKKKNIRNERLLHKQMEEGENAFDFFNLGNEYMSLGKVEEALEMYRKAYKKKQSIHIPWVPFCVVQIATCLIALNRFQEALEVIESAAAVWDRAPDFRYLKAQVYFRQYRWDDAKEEFSRILKEKEKFQYYIKSSDFTEYYPYYFLGKIHEIEKDFKQAVYYYATAFSQNSSGLESLYGLLSVLKKHCSSDEIKGFLDRRLQRGNFNQLEIIKILMNLRETKLAMEYLKKSEIKKTIKYGLEAKIELIDGDTRSFIDLIKNFSLSHLYECVKSGCLDVYDILIASIREQEMAMLTLLYNLIKEDEREFVLFVTEGMGKGNKEHYLQLMERCLQVGQWEVFERLIFRKDAFGPKMNLLLGHLLYQYGFGKLAVAFYREIEDISHYDDQAFVNIIEQFLNTNELDLALQFAYVAIENGHNDFRIFKYAIEIIEKKGNQNDRDNLLQIALKHYPDSNFLKSKMFSI